MGKNRIMIFGPKDNNVDFFSMAAADRDGTSDRINFFNFLKFMRLPPLEFGLPPAKRGGGIRE